MSKVGESLLRGAQEALAYAKKEKVKAKTHNILVPKDIDVKAIRRQLQLTQQAFAERYGISRRTLEKWEQGTRQPERTARAYLLVIQHNPEAVESALAEK